ncbi:glycosyltransferase [Robertmurraya sp.]|uniref:glycosyltransferase n=1 Tax=Robertmurraya sp. TaxID=2837525 RepID=UPI003704BEA0
MKNRVVSIITCTVRDEFMENVFDNFQKQDYKEKELIIILNNDSIDADKWKKRAFLDRNIIIVQLPQYTSLGDCLNYGVEHSRYKTIAKFDDDDFYGPYYMNEAMNVIKNTKAMVVGKSTFYIYFHQEKSLYLYNCNNEQRFIYPKKHYYTKDFLAGASLVINKDVFKQVTFPSLNLGEDSKFQQECLKKDISMYSTTRQHFAYIRYPYSHYHNSDVKDYFLKKRSRLVSKGSEFENLLTQISPS